MTRTFWVLAAGATGVYALGEAAPALSRLVSSLVPLVLVVGVVALVWRVLSVLTRR
jgi:hypothetical protein